jgi:hypothetical protein
MKRLYEYISTYIEEETESVTHDRATPQDLEFLESIEHLEMYVDGDKFSWKVLSPATKTFYLIACTEEELEKLKDFDHRLHFDINGYSETIDVTESVLYGTYDCDRFGFAREAVIAMTYDWRKDHLEEDDLLDKITKYGKESLTEQEIDFLKTGELKNPFLYEKI